MDVDGDAHPYVFRPSTDSEIDALIDSAYAGEGTFGSIVIDRHDIEAFLERANATCRIVCYRGVSYEGAVDTCELSFVNCRRPPNLRKGVATYDDHGHTIHMSKRPHPFVGDFVAQAKIVSDHEDEWWITVVI